MVAANALSWERQDQIQILKQQQQEGSQLSTIDYDDTYIHHRYLAQATPSENPCVLQFGSSNPDQLYAATQAVMELEQRRGIQYTAALNLNCGCPSPKVAGKGCFGAALMDDPALVAQLVTAMHKGCQGQLLVTVKCRIGTDTCRPFRAADDPATDASACYGDLQRFIETVAATGLVMDFSIHARIAVLTKSFSTAENRKAAAATSASNQAVLEWQAKCKLQQSASSLSSSPSSSSLSL